MTQNNDKLVADSESTAVQKIESDQTALSTNVALDFEADAGAGLEGADNSSYAVPFIAMLQGLSPQIETVDGAKPGLMFNTVTEELYSELVVIPCAFQRRFVRWVPREKGGGYRGDFDPIDVETGKLDTHRNDDGKLMIEEDELKDTRNHYVLYHDTASDSWQPALVSMASSKIKMSKRWMSRIRGIELKTKHGKMYNPPSFSHQYLFKPLKEKNEKGTFYNFEIRLHGPVQDPNVYQKAKLFHEQVVSGMVKAVPIDDEQADGDDGAF